MASSSRALATTSSSPSDKPQRSLNRQAVLEEGDYQDALSQIIARDFFPSLVRLEASNDYLSALDSQDPSRIEASVRRLSDLASAPTPTPRRGGGVTPYVSFPSDTPLRTPRYPDQHLPPNKRPKYDPSLSLDAFQSRYTSEDNSSFTEILKEENEKRKEKYAWAWKAEEREMAKKRKEIEGRDRLLIQAGPSSSAGSLGMKMIEGSTNGPAKTITQGPHEDARSESGDSEDEVMRELDEDHPIVRPPTVAKNETDDVDPDDLDGTALVEFDAKGKGKEIVRIETEESQPVDVMAPLKDTRSTTIPGWKFKARNAFMFGPGADVAPYDEVEPVPKTDAELENARIAKPGIIHANTRLPEQSEPTNEPPSPTRSRVAAAIAGKPYEPEDESPNIRGYGYVEAIPTINPTDLGAEQMKQLMTWGTLQGTPRILSVSDDVQSPFVIKAPNSRDVLGRRLGNEAGKSLTRKANIMAGTPQRSTTPASNKLQKERMSASTPRRTEILTPAARRLLDRTRAGKGMGGLGTPVSSSAAGGGFTPVMSAASKRRQKELDLGKVSWTPKESPRNFGRG